MASLAREKRFVHNGLRVVYQHKREPLTAIALAVHAGARFDGPYPGVAHLAEHMLFQGTARWDQWALNRRAAELGGAHNADTSYETILLTIEVFNDQVAAALELLAEQYYRSEVPPERFERERQVVLDEIRGRQSDPVEMLHTKAWCRFFAGAIAHPIYGSLAHVRSMRRDVVIDFLRTHFHHRNTVLAVVGGASLVQVREAVQKYFTQVDHGPPPPLERVDVRESSRFSMKSDSDLGYVAVLFAVMPRRDRLLATNLALEIVGVGPDSVLFQTVREEFGLGYDVSGCLQWGPDWGVMTVGASTAARQVKELERVLLEVCERAAKQGFTPEQMERARRKVRYLYAKLAADPLASAAALAESVLLGFPTPAKAAALVQRLPQAAVEQAWRLAVSGRRVVAHLR